MSNKIKTVLEVSPAQTHDHWHHGESELSPNGLLTYYMCAHYDKLHWDEENGYTTWCKHFDRFEDGSNCNMDCDQYGMCDTCGGFSAVRCAECDIPRP